MALKTDPNRTYARTVVDYEDDKEYEVVFRKLNYGDIEERQQEGIRLRRNSRKKGRKAARERVEYDAKAVDYFTWKRAILSWEFPFPISREDIDELDADIAQQINDYIDEINPSLKAAYDEDEDEEDESEAESTNGHAMTVQPVFGEEEGPTKSAAES